MLVLKELKDEEQKREKLKKKSRQVGRELTNKDNLI